MKCFSWQHQNKSCMCINTNSFWQYQRAHGTYMSIVKSKIKGFDSSSIFNILKIKVAMESLYISHSYCIAIVCVLLFSVSISHAKTIKWKFIKTVGVKFSNVFAERATLSDVSCVDLCLSTGGCVVANYNHGIRTCALIAESQTTDPNLNWHAYGVISGLLLCSFLFLPTF